MDMFLLCNVMVVTHILCCYMDNCCYMFISCFLSRIFNILKTQFDSICTRDGTNLHARLVHTCCLLIYR